MMMRNVGYRLCYELTKDTHSSASWASYGLSFMYFLGKITMLFGVRSWNSGCLVTWFCYQLIAKPGNKTATVPWPDPTKCVSYQWGMLSSSYCWNYYPGTLGLYSPSGWTSNRKISWSLEATRFRCRLLQSFWKLTGTSAAALPRWLSNFRAMWSILHLIKTLRDLAVRCPSA